MKNAIYFEYILDIREKEWPYCMEVTEYLEHKHRLNRNRIEQRNILTFDDVQLLLERDSVPPGTLRYLDPVTRSFLRLTKQYYEVLPPDRNKFRLVLVTIQDH